MGTHLSGSKELIYIETKNISITIKGKPSHPIFDNSECDIDCSELKIRCLNSFRVSIKESEFQDSDSIITNSNYAKTLVIPPLFYEQQQYEIIIESDIEGFTFYHENQNIRRQVTKVGRKSKILSGILNFGSDIGLSDLVILSNGIEFLRIVIEVFPSKIDYKKDYLAIRNDIAEEVFKLIFDFNKKTYQQFGSDPNSKSTHTEFYALFNYFYDDFIKSINYITKQPHYILQTQYEIKNYYKAKRIDSKSIKWLQKHPEQICNTNKTLEINKILSPHKAITFNTKENQFIKYILLSTKNRLLDFKKNYVLLNRETDNVIIQNINSKITGISRKLNNTFLSEISTSTSSFGMSLVFSMATGYRDLYKYYLKLTHGLSFLDEIFNSSTKDVAKLYEYWCFIKLNSILRNKYKLLSRDFLKIDNSGLFYSLKKGQESKVVYINPVNDEKITLFYNPKASKTETITQIPDNVLCIEKKSLTFQQDYKFIFDAKYRIDPALPNTKYFSNYGFPGPEENDINTMHRYRDAIVYNESNNTKFRRSMFGAYVLFPYSNEQEYKNHKFFKSIESVNVGGLPFLPSATECVSNFLDELIGDSSETSFERSTLPLGIDERLAKLDFTTRDVLIGELRTREQYDVCKKKNFYHIPVNKITSAYLPINYIAIYKSKHFFEKQAGIYEYGKVIRTTIKPRNEIYEIPSEKTDDYYYFEIEEWIPLETPISPIEYSTYRTSTPYFTTMFLLEYATFFPELLIKNELEFRLYTEIKYHLNNKDIDKKELGFSLNGRKFIFDNGLICIYKDDQIKTPIFSEEEFKKRPGSVFKSIMRIMESN